MHKMWMWFHTELNDTLLFPFWTVSTVWAMLGSCLLLFVAAFAFEVLKWFRLVLEQQQQQRDNNTNKQMPNANRRYTQSLFTRAHLLQTALFALQLLLSYVLMLAVMSFSLWVLFAVCAGAATGFWLFGQKQPMLVAAIAEPQQQPSQQEIH